MIKQQKYQNKKIAETILTAIKENKKKTNNLISLVESGVKVDSVLRRIKELEHANDLLQEQLRSIDRRRPEKADIKMMAVEIERIVGNFQNEFLKGTLADQKDQIRRFVSAMGAHRLERPRTHCYIRRIPLINQSTGLSLQYVAGEGTHPNSA